MQDTVTKESISESLALRLVEAATARAVKLDVPMVVAICDESGILKAFVRMDGAPLLSVELAIDKARTAVGFDLATHAWYDFIKDDPPIRQGIANIPGLIVFGGGYPIIIRRCTIGGIGVSGGHYSQDMKCAEAALAVLDWPKEPSP